jgi:hypothetical protein
MKAASRRRPEVEAGSEARVADSDLATFAEEALGVRASRLSAETLTKGKN